MSKTNKKKYPNRHSSKLHNRRKSEYTAQELYDEWLSDEDEEIVLDMIEEIIEEDD